VKAVLLDFFVFVGYVNNGANMMGSLNPAEPALGVAKRR